VLVVLLVISYYPESEVAHHASEALCVDVTATFNRLLTLLATFGSFQALQKLLELVNVKVRVRVRSSHFVVST